RDFAPCLEYNAGRQIRRAAPVLATPARPLTQASVEEKHHVRQPVYHGGLRRPVLCPSEAAAGVPPMNVFKKINVRYGDRQGRQVRKDTPGATKTQEFSRKYYGRIPGNPRLVPLATNKIAAELMLAQLVKKAEMEEAGISDPFEVHRRRPLA